MKKTLQSLLFVLLLGLFLTGSARAQSKTISVTDPGTLKTLLADEYATIGTLVVNGKINAKDLTDIAGMPAIVDVDLAAASLTGNNGAAENKLPDYVFSSQKTLQRIVLPQHITVIGEAAFRKCKELITVVLPEGLTTIRKSSFNLCEKLSGINFPSTLQSIGASAFYKCLSLKNFIAPDALTEIGYTAFYNTGLEHVGLNAGLTKIAEAVFAGSGRLQDFTLDVRNSAFRVNPVDGALYTADGQRLVAYPCGSGNQIYKAPTGLCLLGTSAFDGALNLREVYLGNDVTILPISLFYGAKNLRKVYLGDNIQEIKVGIFEACQALQEVHIRTKIVPNTAEYAFFTLDAAKAAKLYVPIGCKAAYEAGKEWFDFFTEILEEVEGGGGDHPTQDLMLLENDFEAAVGGISGWSGDGLIHVDHGAYIQEVNGNKILQLGDNEGDGKVMTKLLDLSGNNGNFRVRFDMDGWNENVRTLRIRIVDRNNAALGDHLVSLYHPGMGKNMRTRDLAFAGGRKDCRIVFYTDTLARIALIDNIKIYTTTNPLPSYKTDVDEIDFGITKKGVNPKDVTIKLTLENITKRPSIKLLAVDLGVFAIDVNWIDDFNADLTCRLDASTVGSFEAFIRIDYEGVNTIMIPIRARVVNPDNIYELDDSTPRIELNEDFNASSKLPGGWKILMPEGLRAWSMRSDGNGNRYVQISGLGTEGKVRSLLVLPALQADQLQTKTLCADLAALRANGATLKLVKINKASGEITDLADYTQTTDAEKNQISFPLKGLGGTLFLAFDYQGANLPEDQRTTIYRVDNVRITEDTEVKKIEEGQSLRITTFDNNMHIESGLPFNIYDLQGRLLAKAERNIYIQASPGETFIVQTARETRKVRL